MSKKQILKIKNPASETIVAMSHASSIYLDNKYFKERMHEDLDSREYGSYPIKLVGLRLGWMLT